MLEPVGGKQTAWHMGEELKCPSDTFPFIFTKNNSAAALAEYQRSTTTEKNEASPPTTMTTTTDAVRSTSHHRKHHKSEHFWSMYNVITVVAIILVFSLIIFAAVARRQQIRATLHEAGRRRFGGFNNAQYSDDADDIDIWNRATGKSPYTAKDQLTKTHGTRINFDS